MRAGRRDNFNVTILMPLVDKCGHWGPDRRCDLLEFTQLVSYQAGIRTQFSWLPQYSTLPFRLQSGGLDYTPQCSRIQYLDYLAQQYTWLEASDLRKKTRHCDGAQTLLIFCYTTSRVQMNKRTPAAIKMMM